MPTLPQLPRQLRIIVREEHLWVFLNELHGDSSGAERLSDLWRAFRLEWSTSKTRPLFVNQGSPLEPKLREDLLAIKTVLEIDDDPHAHILVQML